MMRVCVVVLVIALALGFSTSTSGKNVPANNVSNSEAFCATDKALYVDGNRKPIWLNNESLLKRATHCEAPQLPSLARVARLRGYVSVDVLVDNNGRVSCARLVSGHPLLATSAINAARDWKFRPMIQNGKAVWFYGHLRFHFSTGEIKKDENPCTVAHW